MGPLLVLVGAVLVLAGLVLWRFPGLFSWFGHLPGDIVIRREGTTIFMPITSMIVVSILVSVVLNLLFRGR